MKIAYCIPSFFNSGGMERVLSVKANYLAKQGWEVTIITTGQKDRPPYYSLLPNIRLVDLNINYDEEENLPLYKKWKRLMRKKKLHHDRLDAFLKQLHANIVVSMFTHETSFLYHIKDGSSKVLELHFSRYFRDLHNKYNHVGLLTRIIGKLANYRDTKAVKHYTRFVVLTEEDKESWKSYPNVVTIPNPIPFHNMVRTEFRTKEAIAVGRLCPQKGFDLLIEAWKRLDDCIRKQWHLSIYGSGPERKVLISQIDKEGLTDCISIHEPVKNIQSVYKNSSIFCFSSRYEGFAMAMVEAMSCGLATVSFDCPCGPRDIIRDGWNGMLVTSFDVEAFSKSLHNLMTNEKRMKEIGNNAIISTWEKYEEGKIMQQWVELFNQIVS